MMRPAALGLVGATGNLPQLPPVNGYGQVVDPASDDALTRAGKVAALGTLTPGVAHELNNPLFAVLGLLDLALADSEPGSRAHGRLTVARETALEMRATLRALVAFAREPAAERGPLDLGQAVRETVELVRRTSSGRDVAIVERFVAGPVNVLGSRNELRQSVLHLLANAIAALPDGGTVTVELRRSGKHVEVEVADTGRGVPEELRERIFEPFFTTSAATGGLGLAAARAIADGHAGTLALEPGDGGATFVLQLPVSEGSDG